MPEYSDYIEGLTEATTLTGSEILGLSQGGSARKITVQQVKLFRGAWDASGNLLPSSSVLAGHEWYFSVAGTFGGELYPVGTIAKALVDTPGQTLSNWRLM